ncbi:TPA: hypothetical protein ACMDUP_004537, partial [Vibrio parahaemolyticus]
LMIKANNHVYRSATEFLSLCELAEKQSVEISSFHYAYNANLAFSIELYLKSINASSRTKLTCEVGDAKLYKDFSEVYIKKHELYVVFTKLQTQVQYQLCKAFSKHQCNISCRSLKEVLKVLDNVFVDSRYSFENGGNFLGNDPELLLWTARFFKEILKPVK